MTKLIVWAFLSVQEIGLDELLDRLSRESTLVREEATEALIRRWKEWTAGDLEKLERAAATSDSAKLALDEIVFRRRIPDEVWREEPRVADMAGIFLSIRLQMTEKFVWTGPIEDRDRNLAKIRERWGKVERP